MIERVAADSFWEIVRICLMRFHGLSESQAQHKSTEFRRQIESPPSGLSSEIFYHAEPFDVACDIAGKPLDFPHHREEYLGVLKRRGC